MGDFNLMKPWGMLARCIVNPDISVAYFLHPDNSNLKSDGTEVDWNEVESSGQNVMVQIPKFYSIKKWLEEEKTFYFGVANEPVENEFVSSDEWTMDDAFYRDRTKLCDALDADPVEVDNRYIGAFHGWVDEKGRLRSLPNKLPTVNITINNARNAAKQMGMGWTQLDYFLLTAIQKLYITEYGHPDSQTKIGRGFVDSNSVGINTGGTLDKGNHTFGETTGKKQMSYRGIEDLWGNVYNWLDGFICINGSASLKVSNKGFNNAGTGYIQVGIGTMSAGNIRTIQKDPKAGFIPDSVGLSYDTGGLYDFGELVPACFTSVGAARNVGSVGGAFRFGVNGSASFSSTFVGVRLCV